MRTLASSLFSKQKTLETTCAIGDVLVTLRSDLEHVFDDFTALYPRAVTPEAAGQPPIQIEVRRSGRTMLGRALYRVTADGREIGGRYPGNGVFPLIEWGVNLRIIETRNESVQIHAASMVLNGNGFIFAGDSGCGKSTLAATLLARSSIASRWQYLCDEFALIDADSLMMMPYPKALCIKAGSFPVIESLSLPVARRRDYVKAYKGPVAYVNPGDLRADAVGRPAPVRFVIFPTFVADASPSLMPVPRAEAATELYRCCFNKASGPSDVLSTLTRVVQGARCFRLVVGKPNETADVLETLCDTTATQDARAQTRPTWTKPQIGNARRRVDRATSRRELLKVGVKVAFVAPVVMTLTSRQAFAAASNPSGVCSTATQTGGLCETDLDCCSRQCNLGVCR